MAFTRIQVSKLQRVVVCVHVCGGCVCTCMWGCVLCVGVTHLIPLPEIA